MSKLDLDKMQGAWRQHSQQVEASLKLDVEGVRSRLKLGTASAFKRHLHWLRLEIGFGITTLIALLAFMTMQHANLVYLAASLPLLALLLFTVGTDIHHWRVLSTLNLSAPILQVRGTLDAVRAQRLLVIKWIVLSSCLLWLPLIAVLLKGALGVDLLRGLHISVIAVNVVLGVLLIPIGLIALSWFAKRFAHAPAFQRFVEDASGTTFSAARESFETAADFEIELARNEAQATLAQRQWPAPADALLAQLRRCVLFGIFTCAFLVLGMASVNVRYGGNASTLVPGIFLHAFFVMHMVAGIVHCALLGNLGSKCALPLATQIQSLKQMAHWRGNLAHFSLVLTPLLALALAQVLANAIYAIDLYRVASPGLVITAFACALLLCGLLYRRWRAAAGFANRLSNVVAFGVLNLTQRLLAALSSNSI